MGHTVNTFVRTSLFARVNFKESLIWFKTSDFCYTTRPLLELLLLICVVEILQTQSFRIRVFIYFTKANHRWGSCWGGASHIPVSEHRWWLQNWSVHQISPIFTTRVISPALPQLVYLLHQWTLGRAILLLSLPHGGFFHTWIIMTMSIVLPRQDVGATLPSVADSEGQAQFSYSNHLRAISPISPLLHTADEGQGQISHGHVFQ